jgi:hypothetical protein
MSRAAKPFAAVVLCLAAAAAAAPTPPPKDVVIVNTPTQPIPVTGSVGGTVNIGNTPSVNVANTPTVNVGNTPAVTVSNTPNVHVTNTANVNVSNTPNVSVTNTPNVNVSNTPNVNVGNTPNVNAGQRGAWTVGIDPSANTVKCDSSGSAGTPVAMELNDSDRYTVPAGQRLIIEFVTFYARTDANSSTVMFGPATIFVSDANNSARHTLATTRSDFGNNSFPSQVIASTQQVRAYVAAGGTVGFFIESVSGLPPDQRGISTVGTFSGTLVPAP